MLPPADIPARTACVELTERVLPTTPVPHTEKSAPPEAVSRKDKLLPNDAPPQTEIVDENPDILLTDIPLPKDTKP
jgi:hypothetical protein